MAIFQFLLSRAKPLILDEIWGHVSERASNELSYALHRGAVALLVLFFSLKKSYKLIYYTHKRIPIFTTIPLPCCISMRDQKKKHVIFLRR